MQEHESFLITPVGSPLTLPEGQPLCSISFLRFAQHDSILPDWRALEAKALEPNPFLSPDFLIPARSHLVDGADMGLALAWEEQDGVRSLTGLFPLMPRSRGFGAHWLRSSRTALWHHPLQAMGGALLIDDADQSSRAVAAFLGWLRTLRPRPATCDIRALSSDGPTSRLFAAEAARMGLDVKHIRDPAHTHGLDFRPKGLPPLVDQVSIDSTPLGVRLAVERLICLDRMAQREEKASILGDPRRVAFLRAATRSFALNGTLSAALIDSDAVKAGGLIIRNSDRAFLWWLAGPSATDPMVEAAIARKAEQQLGLPLLAATQSTLSGLGLEPLITESLVITLQGRADFAPDAFGARIAASDQPLPEKTQRM